MKLLDNKELVNMFGVPSPDGTYLVKVTLPYTMRIAWDLKTEIKTTKVHKVISKQFVNAFNEVLQYYGISKIRELGLDIYGGCFEFRLMRNSNKLSRHSWGICFDITLMIGLKVNPTKKMNKSNSAGSSPASSTKFNIKQFKY